MWLTRTTHFDPHPLVSPREALWESPGSESDRPCFRAVSPCDGAKKMGVSEVVNSESLNVLGGMRSQQTANLAVPYR